MSEQYESLSAETKQAVFSASDIVVEPVDVPEWKIRAWVKGLTTEQWTNYQASIVSFDQRTGRPKVNSKDSALKLLILSVVSGEHNMTPVFTDDDLPELRKRSSKAIERIVSKAREISAVGDEEDIEKLKNV